MLSIAIQSGIAPNYFLDEMQEYEVDCMIDAIDERNKNEWEQTRTVAYITAQVNTTKKLSPTDILKFAWDSREDKADWDEIKTMREELKKQRYGSNEV